MKKYWKRILLAALVIMLTAILIAMAGEYLTFEALKRNSLLLSDYVAIHYPASLLVFASCFVATSFLLPGALGLTVMGGFLFGAVPGALYASLFSTAGATLAFLVSRHLLGSRVQERYRSQLLRFNREMERYGNNYLFVMRIVPVLPAFVINYLSGITRISTARFAVVSFLGMLPGALVYAAAGRELSIIETPDDILSAGLIISFSVLAVAAMAPVVYFRVSRWLRSVRPRPEDT